MFSFHKPRVYRSSEGCCICRAKTSSSRFIDSRKYEKDAMKCFLLDQARKGEICNACVLLVKRFKRLPVGSNKNWGHVVDARAGGPGTKITKTSSTSISTVAPCTNSTNTTTASAAAVSRSLIPEKFAKIFKKNKKSKSPPTVGLKAGEMNPPASTPSKRLKVTANNQFEMTTSSNNSQSTNSNNDHPESDGDDAQYAVPSSLQNGTFVEFQTETRASSYRSRKSSAASSIKTEANNSNTSVVGRRRPLNKMGSKRRKCFLPKKRFKSWEEEEYKNEFFDSNEWLMKKTCCGLVYESSELKNALLLKTEEFKPCAHHFVKKEQQQNSSSQSVQQQHQLVKRETAIVKGMAAASQQKPYATIPAVVQIQTQPSPPSAQHNQVQLLQAQGNNSSALLPPPPPQVVNQQHQQQQPSVNISKPTQVLKKHHLFFKRQSECFPQGDINMHNISSASSATNNSIKTSITPIKNETSSVPMKMHVNDNNNSSSKIPPVKIETTYPATSTVVFSSSSSSSLNPSFISTTPSSSTATHVSNNTVMTTYMPRHSSAKVTTISTPLSSSHQIPINTTAASSSTTLSKSQQQLLHKIKPDSGKIVKHSLEKINGTVRIKPSDLQEMKHVIKTVDKSYVLAKPSTTTISSMNNNGSNNNLTGQNNHSNIHLQQYQHVIAASQNLSAATIAAGASSPSSVSSTSSSSSTKYSDNSSDSGFDENMLDRKSASPLQEDTDRRFAARTSVQIAPASSNVSGSGSTTSTSGSIQAKMTTVNKFTPPTSSAPGTNNASATLMHHHQPHQNNSRTTTVAAGTASAVKIAQIIGTNSMSHPNTLQTTTISGGSHVAKMRAIYNNNTIQHENGITTIVPASSLAASTQQAAMNSIPPNTVTITPAPLQHGKKIITNNATTISAANYQNQHIQNLLANSTTTINPVINTYNIQQQHHHHTPSHLHHTTTANLNHAIGANQKIILLKTSSATTIGTANKYNTNTLINNNTHNFINKSLLTSNTIQTITVPTSATISAQNLSGLNVVQATTNPQTTIIKTRP